MKSIGNLRSQIIYRLATHRRIPSRQVYSLVMMQPQSKYFCNANRFSCWSCHIALVERQMFCSACGSLQKLDSGKITYFNLLETEAKFDIDTTNLTSRFRELQNLVHPDRFINKSEEEQGYSQDWSAFINKAYKTLSVPIKRGEYIVEMHSKSSISEENTSLDKEFLMDMMERNESIEEAESSEEMNKLLDETRSELDCLIKELSDALDANDFTRAEAVIVKMRYFLSMENKLKDKIQSIT